MKEESMPQPRKREGDGLADLLAAAALSAKRVANALRLGNRPSIDIVKDGTKLVAVLNQLQKGVVEELIEKERKSLNEAVAALEDVLRQFCVKNGLALAGAFPDFIVGGVVYLRLQPSTFTVVINDRKVPAVPTESVFEEIASQSNALTRSSKSPQAIVATLGAAYEAVVKDKTGAGHLATKRASVFELLPRIAFLQQDKAFLKNPVREKFNSYSLHNLRADLFCVMQQEHPVEHSGRRLVVEPTSVAEQGLFMFIPALQRCGYVGHISFVGAGQ